MASKPYADVAELADALDLGSSGRPCRFDSCHPHHIGTQVLIRYLRSFSFYKKLLGTRLFGTFMNGITFIVSKLNTKKSRLSDSNLFNFAPTQITMTLFLKNSVIVERKVSL